MIFALKYFYVVKVKNFPNGFIVVWIDQLFNFILLKSKLIKNLRRNKYIFLQFFSSALYLDSMYSPLAVCRISGGVKFFED